MIDNSALFKLTYGLFVITTNDGEKDNGCIVNTVTQITDSPKRISVAVNKQNYTCVTIKKTGKFTVSILTQETPFEVFRRFGFQSGREVNKFDDFQEIDRCSNGLIYLTKFSNAFISANVIDTIDCGTHLLFIAEVDEAKILSQELSVTYEYYFANIKPKTDKKVKGWVCKICGYVYEGDKLPKDFICPICKHGADDFEPTV